MSTTNLTDTVFRDYAGAQHAMACIADAGNARRRATMSRIRQADATARWNRQRRQAAHAAGYRGPLTRAEASRRQLALLATQAGR